MWDEKKQERINTFSLYMFLSLLASSSMGWSSFWSKTHILPLLSLSSSISAPEFMSPTDSYNRFCLFPLQSLLQKHGQLTATNQIQVSKIKNQTNWNSESSITHLISMLELNQQMHANTTRKIDPEIKRLNRYTQCGNLGSNRAPVLLLIWKIAGHRMWTIGELIKAEDSSYIGDPLKNST